MPNLDGLASQIALSAVRAARARGAVASVVRAGIELGPQPEIQCVDVEGELRIEVGSGLVRLVQFKTLPHALEAEAEG